MYNQNNQEVTQAANAFVSPNLPNHVQRRVETESYEIARKMTTQNMIISARGIVTQSAMQSVASLSALEAQLTEMYPNSEKRLNYLLNSHTENLARYLR